MRNDLTIYDQAADRWWSDDIRWVRTLKNLVPGRLSWMDRQIDWQGKAGGYGIQGPAGALIPWIQGSFTAIVGLPLVETAGLLQAAGYPIWKDRP